MSISIRPIRLSDADGYNKALGEVARERRFLRLIDAPSLESSRAFIAHNIDRANPHLVALDQDALIGWCDINRSTETGSEHCGWLGMGLLGAYRGKGIGAALLEKTLDAASDRFHRIELEVYASNHAAIGLYEKLGFAHEGRRHDALRREDGFEDILLMARILTPAPPPPAPF